MVPRYGRLVSVFDRWNNSARLRFYFEGLL